MTPNDPLSPGDPVAVYDDDNTEACRCLVVGYAKDDGLIARVAAEAGRRVALSPALGDFIELQHVDLGPQPGQAGDRFRPVRRIVAGLMTERETAGRNHFALIVIAKSAVDIEGLLGSCAADPFLAGLRMRLVGIASSDDRQEDARFADIKSSPAGSWRSERDLVDTLYRRCEELPSYFAARGEAGLTPGELAAHRQAHAGDAAGREGDDGDDPAGTAVPDVLGQVPAQPAAAPLPRSVTAYSWRPSIPSIPWLRGKQAPTDGDPGAAAASAAPPSVPQRTAMALVYLLMVADHDGATDPALGRLQSLLLDVDRQLAAQPSCGYQVRLIHGNDGDLRGELLDAGKLGRRAVKRSVKTADFTAVLKSVRSSLHRDCGFVETIAKAAGLAVAPPAVIFVTADPPMADLRGAAEFGDLAAEAIVMWVVPENLEELVSPGFGPAGGAAVIGEHQAAAGGVLRLMHTGVTAS